VPVDVEIPRARAPRADAVRNRAKLVRAAREVFEADGFVNSRITDIAAGAGVAHGCFYSHFRNKEDALAAVLDELQEEMLHPGPNLALTEPNPWAVITAANRAYLEAYRRNARLMALLEQLATVDERFADMRKQRSDAFVTRNARAIRRLQRSGQADQELDADIASLAISSMVSRTAYTIFVADREPADLEPIVQTLSRLWANALRIPEPKDRSADQ
jgi:AcrR family transcriptional regulator